jgi:hypothetical protein
METLARWRLRRRRRWPTRRMFCTSTSRGVAPPQPHGARRRRRPASCRTWRSGAGTRGWRLSLLLSARPAGVPGKRAAPADSSRAVTRAAGAPACARLALHGSHRLTPPRGDALACRMESLKQGASAAHGVHPPLRHPPVRALRRAPPRAYRASPSGPLPQWRARWAGQAAVACVPLIFIRSRTCPLLPARPDVTISLGGGIIKPSLFAGALLCALSAVCGVE